MSPQSEALEALKQELATTNVILSGFYDELHASRVETAVRVEGLRAEQNRERRVRMIVIAGGGFGLFIVTGQHVEHCSPGARVARAVDYLIHHPIKPGETADARESGFAHVYNSAPGWCDAVQPLSTHNGATWPSGGNAVGTVAVAALALGVAIFHRVKTIRDFGQVRRAAEAEKPSRSSR
jgi:hypothetical protein